MPAHRLAFPLVASAALLALSACGGGPPPAPPPPEVEVVTVRPETVRDTIELPARVQAYRTAEVRARVDGVIERRLYEEGTDVREGQALFRIDPRETQAQLNSATAALRRAEATAANARAIAQRYRPLVAEQAISKQEYDSAVAADRQGEADVASARAQVATARLAVSYANVTAPISGRASRADVTEGALVSAANATLLTRIEQLDQVYVNFSQSSGELLKLRQDIAAGRVKLPSFNSLNVRLKMEDGSTYPLTGKLDFLDLAVDEATGSVSLRAKMPNPQRLLLPGQFVTAMVEAGTRDDGLTVPQRAVQISSQGAMVLTIGKGDVATATPVVLGPLVGDKWLIRDGLKPGMRVIVNGMQMLRPGAKVRIAKPGLKPAAAPAAAPQK
jgi:membrane fusion protein (multidrug efflux system)